MRPNWFYVLYSGPKVTVLIRAVRLSTGAVSLTWWDVNDAGSSIRPEIWEVVSDEEAGRVALLGFEA